MTVRRKILLGAVALAAVVALARTVPRLMPSPPHTPGVDVAEWPTADGFEGNHFSPLSDIGPENVEHLEVVWRYRTGDVASYDGEIAGTAFESTPVMVDGVLYVVTPFGRAIALDADTGAELWTFDPGLDRSGGIATMVTVRGLAVWRDGDRAAGTECATRVFVPVHDARLFALDGATGRPCPDFRGGEGIDLGAGVSNVDAHFKQTAPPTLIGDVVVMGSTILDGNDALEPSGVVRGFDARTGEVRWAWEPLIFADGPGGDSESETDSGRDGGDAPADEAVGEPDGRGAVLGAANTWANITADAERDLLFIPTSSPSPDHYGGLRPGDNRFANSLVALRGSTGELVWHYQVVHHDLWDYDLPSPATLITIERDGAEIPAVVQTTKMGYVFVFHRETGEPLFPVEEVPVPQTDVPGEWTSPTQPVPTLPPPLAPQGLSPEDAWGLTPWDRGACARRIEALRSDGVFAPPSVRGTIVYPGFIGGLEWGGVGYDPQRDLMVTNSNRMAMIAQLHPKDGPIPEAGPDAKFAVAPQEGAPYAVTRAPLLSPLSIPCNPPPWGMLHAVRMSTGEIEWEVPLGQISDLAKIPTPKGWGSPNLGGPLVTGGVVFIGATLDRRLRAFDLATGEALWSAKLPASIISSPLTYRTRPGARQLVVVTAGGHDGLRASLGDHVVAFGLANPTGGADGS